MAPRVQAEMVARRASELEDNANCSATPDFPFSYVDRINLPVLILFS